MNALVRLQRDFRDYIFSAGAKPAVLDAIAGNAAANPAERAGVYVHAYTARLLEVLENDFIALRFAAGDEVFYDLCRDYVRATPSGFPNVRWYGQDLADFLRLTPPWSDTPAFAELAQLEWTIGLAFDAIDEKVIGEADVAAIPYERWGEMRLRPPQNLHRLQLQWNVGEVRQARDRQRPCPRLRRHRQSQPWIVSRQNHVVRYRRLQSDEAAALDTILDGAPFAQMCEALCRWHEQESVPLRAASLLKAWIGNGWIAGILPSSVAD